MDIKKVYKQLTGVDIEDQKHIWDERGKGYYGEFVVFCELYKHVIGTGKILMNLNIPVENGGTTEIDLLLIHETGFYVFEIKHYKGTIYGDSTGEIWTQYFRTAKNNTFRNPILQNEYHINALKKIFPDTPINSVIVFTNSECTIKVKNLNPNIDVSTLNNLDRNLFSKFTSCNKKYSMAEIDEIFNKLSVYSNMQETVEFEGKEQPFLSWLQPIILELGKERNNLITTSNRLEKEKNEFIENLNKSKEKMRIKTRRNTKILIAFILVSLLFIYTIDYSYHLDLEKEKNNYNLELAKIENDYNLKLEEFKNNFKHVDAIKTEYMDKINEYVDITNVSLTSDAVSFTAKLSVNNDNYGIALTETSKYIVMTNDGNVFEYDVFGKHLAYNRYLNMIGKGIRDSGTLAQIKFYDVKKEDISYIKLTDIELFNLDKNKTLVKDNLEIELYNKNDTK